MADEVDDLELTTLVAELRRGSEAASATLYDAYGTRIHEFLTRMLRNSDDAADATQDTFLLATQRIHQLREPDRLRGWLFTIARFEGLRHARRRRARSEANLDLVRELVDLRAPAPDEAAEHAELHRLVGEAIAALPHRDQRVLALAYHRGLAGSELGEVLGVTANHAAVIARRARARARRAYHSLLVARHGLGCPTLTTLLVRWDGEFTPAVEQTVGRHIRHCDVCAEPIDHWAEPCAEPFAEPFAGQAAEPAARPDGPLAS